MMQIDGDRAPRTTTVQYNNLPGVVYEVGATLFGSNGQQRAATARQIEMLSRAGQ